MDYKLNDIVVHSNGGVFIINEIKVMNYGFGDVNYFCLRPYFLDTQKETLVVYVPETKASVLIRPVLTKQEASALIDDIKQIEPVWYNNVKERKAKFADLMHSGEIKDLCLVLKSLYTQQKKLLLENRSLNLMDYDYLNKIKRCVEEELSIVLEVPLEQVESKITEAINE